MASLPNMVRRIRGRYQRSLARHFARRMVNVALPRAVVSFTFDDFPRSAFYRGGQILSGHGFCGTYFTALGLMGRTTRTGQIFLREDLEELVRSRHEIGCHTFDHYHAWDTRPAEFEASICRNRDQFAALLPGVELRNFSYPKSCPRPQTKRRTQKYYATARGGGQTFNIGPTDLNQLQAFFLEQSRDRFELIERVIDDNARAKGWLILATHDVADAPTRFGCTPDLFERVVGKVAQSGAEVLTIEQARLRIQPPA